MDNKYILEPSVELAEFAADHGHFTAEDYIIAMESNIVPQQYWKRVESQKESARKVVIIGSHEAPMMVTKSAFLALTMAKPEKLTIKSSCADETALLKKMIDQNKVFHECDSAVYYGKDEELQSNAAWLKDIETATDVIVFGGIENITFLLSENINNNKFFVHKPKFSLGVVTADCLDDEDNLAGFAGDFLSYFGEGVLGPRFYITLGKLHEDQLVYIEDCIRTEMDAIMEFRSKLPLAKQVHVLQDKMASEFIYPHIKKAKFEDSNILSPLFGDVRIVEARSEDEIYEFVEKYENNISTIAVNEDTMGDMVAGWEVEIPRYCDLGSMQFPYFYEQYDTVDDLSIFYNDKDEKE
jgi:hypothetical protein